MNDPNLSSFIWSVADLLRGDYKQSESSKVILPFTVLLRLDCVLEKTKAGYEIPFNRHFYVLKPPRDLAELNGVIDRNLKIIGELSK
jgi:hypothetical protein